MVIDRATLPNRLTQARLVAVPLCLFAYCLDGGLGRGLAVLVFLAATVTDFLDGWLARRWGVTSDMGAFLDPVADKLLVTTMLVAVLYRHPELLLMLATAIIIGREIVISALREWMAARGLRDVVAVGWAGKVKTTLQMLALLALIAGGVLLPLGRVLLLVAAALTLVSMLSYLRAAWPHLAARA